MVSAIQEYDCCLLVAVSCAALCDCGLHRRMCLMAPSFLRAGNLMNPGLFLQLPHHDSFSSFLVSPYL